MNTQIHDEQIWLAVGSLAVLAVVVLAVALNLAQGVMIPFVLAIFVATTVSPLVDVQVIRWGFPQWLAVTLAMISVLVIVAVLGLILILAVETVVATATEYSEDFAGLTERSLSQLRQWRIEIDQQTLGDRVRERLAGWAAAAVGTATGLLSNGAMVLIFVAFLLAGRDPHLIRSGIYAEIEAKVRSYIGTKFVLSAATGLLVWVILAAFGLPMAGLFGLLTFLLNFIPSIGSIIATLLPLPVAMAQPWDAWRIIAVVALPGAVQMTVGNVIEPKLMGKGLELHPVVILLALTFWGLVWGVAGMVLAVPITASIRIVLVRFVTTRPIGNLLAGELPGREKPC